MKLALRTAIAETGSRPRWLRRALILQGMFLLNLHLLLFAQQPSGEAVYRNRCARCHDHAMETKALPRSLIRLMTPAQIRAVLESGRMKDQGSKMTPAERQAVARFLSSSTHHSRNTTP